jgi:radical SAM enzyme (TIGR01210 family)
MNSSNSDALPVLSDAEIIAARPARNTVDPSRPYAFLVEPERTADGCVEDVVTIFLTNRECPFKCLMCDLWKNTTETSVPAGAIPQQLDYALARLPPASHIKLYNSGNFFDRQAVPAEDYGALIERVRGFKTVIVENHPRLCTAAVAQFQQDLATDLEVALGLETVHPEILPRLNKRMTLDDFARAVEFLLENGIHVRSFILLKPPPLDEQEGIEWALRSLEYAFGLGVRCCTVIPTRGGNGVMEDLQRKSLFSPPVLTSLERVLEAGIRLGRGRVFVDLWDARSIADCNRCADARIERLRQMNLQQVALPEVSCDCDGVSGSTAP